MPISSNDRALWAEQWGVPPIDAVVKACKSYEAGNWSLGEMEALMGPVLTDMVLILSAYPGPRPWPMALAPGP